MRTSKGTSEVFLSLSLATWSSSLMKYGRGLDTLREGGREGESEGWRV